MTVNIPTFYVMEFSSNVALLLQQTGSKLRGTTQEQNHVGKQASPVDQIGSVEMQRVTTRFEPRTRTDAPTDRRWVFPVDYDLSQMVDSFDKLRTINDLQSPYAQNAAYAAGRALDGEIIKAFFGDAKTGEQGATTTSFPTTTNQVAVATGGANSKLNAAKLKLARKLLQKNFVDFDREEVYVGITAEDDSALLDEIQMISSDFAGTDRPVLKDGKISQFLGMRFVHCELLETKSTGTNKVRLPVYVKSGMHLGIWWDAAPTVAQRNDIKGDPWQLALNKSFGATRIEEKKVLEIESYRA